MFVTRPYSCATTLCLLLASPGALAADLIPAPIPTGDIAIELEEVAADFAALPLQATVSPVGGGFLYVVDQTGQVYELDPGTGQTRVFMDVGNRLVNLNSGVDERGLLGLAFHPDYQSNGRIYTYTSEPVTGSADFSTLAESETPNHQSVIIEWTVDNPTDANAIVDEESARELLRIDQPQANHNGGALAFDTDGNLYITLGDGGGGDDQGVGHADGGNGQEANNVLGTVLRIEPLGNNSANGNYGIPTGNPFVGAAPPDEIFATGLRNPFRLHVDNETGEMWLPDVGQNDIEEINVLVAGANYGWNWKEGTFFFDPNGAGSGFATDVTNPAAPADLVDPIAQYDHDEGVAVIGGAVYRGTAIPPLDGLFVFGDFAGNSGEGRIFYLDDGTIREFDMPPLDAMLTGFGQGGDGEIYVLVNDTGAPAGQTGTVYRMKGAAGSAPPAPPPPAMSSGGGGAALFLFLILGVLTSCARRAAGRGTCR